MPKTNLIAEPGSHALSMTREFNAPREMVYRAFIEPELVAQWWGQDSTTVIVDKLEPRKGGMWRFVLREPSGEDYAFNGVFHEVASPERIVYTFEFEGMPGQVLLETITFEEKGGKTIVVDSSVFQSVEARDGMIQAGMEQGANESWKRLEALLKRL